MAGHQGDASSSLAHGSKGPWTHSFPPTPHGSALGVAVPLGALEEGWPGDEARPQDTCRLCRGCLAVPVAPGCWPDHKGNPFGRDESRLGSGARADPATLSLKFLPLQGKESQHGPSAKGGPQGGDLDLQHARSRHVRGTSTPSSAS